jgi:hypothetical protein
MAHASQLRDISCGSTIKNVRAETGIVCRARPRQPEEILTGCIASIYRDNVKQMRIVRICLTLC